MSATDLPGYDPLQDDFRDQLVAIGKGAVSLVPLIGGPLAEIIAVSVPNQRADRVAAYLRNLAQRVETLSAEMQDGLKANAAKIDLIEEGGYQSARAMSDERIEQIAAAVFQGLSESDTDILRRRRLLVIFGQLDDDEVALLNAYGQHHGGSDQNPFGQINRPEPAFMGSSAETIELERLYRLGKDHLLRLELLERKYSSVKKDHLPEFDQRTGQFKHTVRISFLGRMLLKEIGMPTPIDEARRNRSSH